MNVAVYQMTQCWQPEMLDFIFDGDLTTDVQTEKTCVDLLFVFPTEGVCVAHLSGERQPGFYSPPASVTLGSLSSLSKSKVSLTPRLVQETVLIVCDASRTNCITSALASLYCF